MSDNLSRALTALSVMYLCTLTLHLHAQRFASDKYNTTGLYIGSQAYELSSLNSALSAQGYPTIIAGSLQFGLLSTTRKPGRHQFSSGFTVDIFSIGESQTGAGERTRAVEFGILGLHTGYAFDLLYPSAWNVLLGADLGLSGGRLTTTNFVSDFSAPAPNFDRATEEAKFNFGSVYVTPTLTLETFPLDFGSTESRIFIGIGYRLGTGAALSRQGFADLTYPLEIENQGFMVRGGMTWRIPTLRELLQQTAE